MSCSSLQLSLLRRSRNARRNPLQVSKLRPRRWSQRYTHSESLMNSWGTSDVVFLSCFTSVNLNLRIKQWKWSTYDILTVDGGDLRESSINKDFSVCLDVPRNVLCFHSFEQPLDFAEYCLNRVTIRPVGHVKEKRDVSISTPLLYQFRMVHSQVVQEEGQFSFASLWN